MKRALRQDRPQAGRPEGHNSPAGAYPMRVLAPVLLLVALVVIAAAGYWLKRPPEAVAVPCADPLAGCAFSHHGAPARVRFSVRPAPLEAFELNVRAVNAARISAEFQMVGMDMGFNRYDLRRAEDGTWTSTVTLPACVSGQGTWVVYLDLDGSRYALPFSTQ